MIKLDALDMSVFRCHLIGESIMIVNMLLPGHMFQSGSVAEPRRDHLYVIVVVILTFFGIPESNVLQSRLRKNIPVVTMDREC